MVIPKPIWVAALLLILAVPPAALAQRSPAGGGRAALAGGLAGPLELLARNDVKQELELVDDQLEALSRLRQRLQDRRREVFNELRQAGDRARARDRIREEMQASKREVQSSLKQILLPHQYSRLNELQLQLRLRSGTLGAFVNRQVVEDLGISESQQSQLREKGLELEQELRQRVAELRRQVQAKLLDLLTPQQREKFEALLGRPFEFQEEGRRRRVQRSGARRGEGRNPAAESP